jgi:type II secretory pathway pseudopilin PulG
MKRDSRRGLTIVELLVVTGLMAAVFGLVMVMGRPSPSSTIRQAAREFASLLLAAQSRGLGVTEGAAVIIQPLGSDLGTVVYEAEMLPLLRGCMCDGMPPEPGQVEATLTFLNGLPSAAERLTAYKIRFGSAPEEAEQQPLSPWYAFTPPNTARFRQTSGQTAGNTVWPRAAGVLEAYLARFPVRGDSALTFSKQVAIDLRHSGVGEELSSPADGHGYGTFAGKGSLAVVYDDVGRVGEVMRWVDPADQRPPDDQPIVPTQTIYFLFAPRSEIEAGANTLANSSAIWVAINPQTGRVTVANNVPQEGDGSTALAAARENARTGASLK